jgi:ABC-type bacteriocin/lantibiotic exporter with double-glycine peptidase domain
MSAYSLQIKEPLLAAALAQVEAKCCLHFFVCMKFEDWLIASCAWQANELYDAANQTASEAFAAIRTVAAFSLQGPLVQLYEKLLEKPQVALSSRAHASGLGFGFSQFAVFSVYALAFWYGGQLMRQGEMDFGQVLKVTMCPPSCSSRLPPGTICFACVFFSARSSVML